MTEQATLLLGRSTFRKSFHMSQFDSLVIQVHVKIKRNNISSQTKCFPSENPNKTPDKTDKTIP